MLRQGPADEWIDGVIVGSLALLEGLPHPGWEKELFDREIQRVDIVRIAGWPFYSEPLPVSMATAISLETLALDPSSYAPRRGETRCGGFHPDYALSWERGRRGSHLLLCFGCSEALMFDREVRRRVNLRDPRKFVRELESYQQHRPHRPPL